MLNRLFIIVGVVAILAIAAAFVVPSFTPWGQYRDRLEAIASEALGTPVRIKGDVSFSLLPQPRLRLADVSAGPEGAPNLRVEIVEADFSLIDFLRDRYNVTRLELGHPTVTINVGEGGAVDTGLAPGKTVQSNIAIANAVISGGRGRRCPATHPAQRQAVAGLSALVRWVNRQRPLQGLQLLLGSWGHRAQPDPGIHVARIGRHHLAQQLIRLAFALGPRRRDALL